MPGREAREDEEDGGEDQSRRLPSMSAGRVWAGRPENHIRFPTGVKKFLSCTASRPALGSIHLPVYRGLGLFDRQ
jgi:hypothetical protein